MSKLINLTPHPINIILSQDDIISIPSSNEARVSSSREYIHPIELDDILSVIKVNKMTLSNQISNIPDILEPDTYYIVSRIVKQAIENNHPIDYSNKFIVPDELVRDSSGNIIGTKSFSL